MRSFRRICVLLILLVSFLSAIPRANAGGFSQSKPLNSGWKHDKQDDEAQSVAMDDAGHCVAVWQRGGFDGSQWHFPQIYTSRSSDGGKTWTRKAVLNSNADVEYTGPPIDGGYANTQPSVATDGHGTWVCVWLWNGPIGVVEGFGSTVVCAQSRDNGATWSRAKIVNTDYADTDLYRYEPRIAADERGRWMCVWTAPYEDAGEYYHGVFCATSKNRGKTWSSPIRIAGSGLDTGIGAPTVISDHNGLWLVAWVRASEDGYFIHYATSAENGLAWTDPKQLIDGTELPYQYPYELATDHHGGWMAAFAFGSLDLVGLFEIHSTDNAASWSQPKALATTASSNPSWGDRIGLATDSAGRWIVIWQESPSEYEHEFVYQEANGDFSRWSRVKPMRKRDNPKILNKRNPVLAANRYGDWLAVWVCSCLHETDATGEDICFATKKFGPPAER